MEKAIFVPYLAISLQLVNSCDQSERGMFHLSLDWPCTTESLCRHFQRCSHSTRDDSEIQSIYKVIWTPIREKAFQELKGTLTLEAVLISPNLDKLFILQTNASGIGIGAVVSQKDAVGID